MHDLGGFGPTTKIAVTITAPILASRFVAGSAASPSARYRYMVTADADCFIKINADADTTTSAYIIAKMPYMIIMFAMDTLSFITPTGTANLYITPISVN